VGENPNGGYHIHVQLNERGRGSGRLLDLSSSIPPGTPVLAEMLVFEDCVVLVLRNEDAIVIHVSDPKAAGSVIFFYHADGTLWRVVPLEQLNPGWVCSTYSFRGDLRKFEARLERMRSRPARASWKTAPTFWATGGWVGCRVHPTGAGSAGVNHLARSLPERLPRGTRSSGSTPRRRDRGWSGNNWLYQTQGPVCLPCVRHPGKPM